ncbi:YiiX family permuted papain-like enzyme [Leptospira interrogans]|uniref:Orthopoxovirus protein, PF05708 family n=2 Tax=Leptospira interrogans TaxID=173 RepID=A0A0F6IJJ0_LEPIR|nr:MULTISPECIES: YiiX family permuted papain-like enzyme [Leptospira]EJO78695.1 orthopoxovirus protein, PF05708 family [Leptospira interrogans serovar Pomona str. Kennewicki LC82-25]EKN95244.1 orthopoxovirus protein, PF05708 family [Leptospira interrogans serovar Pomona str. Pomona]EKR33889.1 orthopoxovirus protein, PF05708 family [Leptospira interrogans serovar Hebdomadis str. R499]EKR84546.1 orthopoxovirus protein, PF05708 family [Leptospira interrogans str. UI 08452]EMF34847.1 orthopoxoviru
MKHYFEISFLISIFLVSFQLSSEPIDKIKEGDLIFQETFSEQGKAIKIATRSRYTHVGIIFKYKEKLKVLEAVEPVKITEIDTFISKGKNKHFVIKRLANSDMLLTEEKIRLMKSIGNQYIGKHYDIYFNWSDEKIYCTELAWKIFKQALNIELTEEKRLKDFDLSNPAVKYLMKKRYGKNIPFNDFVVSPADMFSSKKLKTIMELN